MDCENTSHRLSAYLDGELSAEEEAEVRRHLQACPRCAGELAAFERLDEAIGSLDPADVPPGFARRVREAAEGAREPVRRWRPAVVRLRPVLARAAAVLVMIAGLWVGALAGHSATRPETPNGQSEASAFELPVDPLSAAPSGSVTDAYLNFIDESERGG